MVVETLDSPRRAMPMVRAVGRDFGDFVVARWMLRSIAGRRLSSALCKVECCAGGGISGLDIVPVDPTTTFLGALVDFDKEPTGEQGRLGRGHDSSPWCFHLRRDPGAFSRAQQTGRDSGKDQDDGGPNQNDLPWLADRKASSECRPRSPSQRR
jgi:hypothetical protein